jgi:hypothetical protein
MPQTKRASIGKRPGKAAASFLGIAGVSLAATAGGSVAALPSQFTGSFNPVTLGDEEISDVSLATFHVYNLGNENTGALRSGIQLAHGGCGCGGGGGCAHGCGGGGCAHGCGGGCAHGCAHGCGGGCAHGCGGCAHGCGGGCGGCGRGCGGCGCGLGGCGCAGGGGCCLSWGGCWPTC